MRIQCEYDLYGLVIQISRLEFTSQAAILKMVNCTQAETDMAPRDWLNFPNQYKCDKMFKSAK